MTARMAGRPASITDAVLLRRRMVGAPLEVCSVGGLVEGVGRGLAGRAVLVTGAVGRGGAAGGVSVVLQGREDRRRRMVGAPLEVCSVGGLVEGVGRGLAGRAVLVTGAVGRGGAAGGVSVVLQGREDRRRRMVGAPLEVCSVGGLVEGVGRDLAGRAVLVTGVRGRGGAADRMSVVCATGVPLAVGPADGQAERFGPHPAGRVAGSIR